MIWLIRDWSAINTTFRKRSCGDFRKVSMQREAEFENEERELKIAREKEELEEVRLKRRREELELQERELELQIRQKAAGL